MTPPHRLQQLSTLHCRHVDVFDFCSSGEPSSALEVVHLALQFAACCGELRNLLDGGVDFGADISDAQVVALEDQAHTLPQGMHVYEERKEQDKSSTLQLDFQVP